jgi:four helix bundle protein
MNNIAEGFESQSNRTFIRYLYQAKGSAGEVRSLLYVALDQGYINQDEFRELYDQATTVSRLIGGFINYLYSVPDKPPGQR